VFAREYESLRQIKGLCRADIAHDCAFFFEHGPYRRSGDGVLHAFRTDRDARPFILPPDNNDISRTCESLDEWLWTIARHEIVRTDRAHVTIAAALLGKKVEYRSSRYHKVPGIVEFSLKPYSVEPLQDSHSATIDLAAIGDPSSSENAIENCQAMKEHQWWQDVRTATREIASIVHDGKAFILVDDNRLGRLALRNRWCISFTERGGRYWGPPANDRDAIRDLQRLRDVDPEYIVFAWPAFWWLDHYAQFAEYLRANFVCLLQNERLIAFHLQTRSASDDSCTPLKQ
jgi:hypothetical protein